MPYSHKRGPKKLYDGKTLVPLTVANRIIKIRSEIEANAPHAGPNLELVYQAYKEIQEAHGKTVADLNPACNGCTKTMNDQLKRWFALYDQGTIQDKAKSGALKTEPLKPIEVNKIKKAAEKAVTNAVKTIDALMKPVSEKPKKEKKPEPRKTANDLPTGYADLLTMFNEVATESEKKNINGGAQPKKKQIIEFFNGK